MPFYLSAYSNVCSTLIYYLSLYLINIPSSRSHSGMMQNEQTLCKAISHPFSILSQVHKYPFMMRVTIPSRAFPIHRCASELSVIFSWRTDGSTRDSPALIKAEQLTARHMPDELLSIQVTPCEEINCSSSCIPKRRMSVLR